MKIVCDKTKELYSCYDKLTEKYVASALLLAIRVFIGLVFLKSGLVKFSNVDSAVLLFEYEYQVPLLPPVVAAYSAMFFEIACGGLLIVGFFSKLAALPLFVMTLVIQFFVFENPEHFYWMFLLGTVGVYGGGRLSLGCLLCRFCKKKGK